MSPLSSLTIKDTGRTNEQGRVVYEVVEPFTFKTAILTVKVPRGFLTDFASVPRFMWLVFPPTGKYNRPATIHDFLYVIQPCSRWTADAVFREAMIEAGVPFWKRWLIWAAVRVFGPRFKK